MIAVHPGVLEVRYGEESIVEVFNLDESSPEIWLTPAEVEIDAPIEVSGPSSINLVVSSFISVNLTADVAEEVGGILSFGVLGMEREYFVKVVAVPAPE